MPASAGADIAGEFDRVMGVWYSGGVQSRITYALTIDEATALHVTPRTGAATVRP